MKTFDSPISHRLGYRLRAILESMTAINPTFGKDVFLEWRSPKRGNANPQRLNNPVWSWLIQTGESSYNLNDHFDGPNSYGGEPQWSFERFGQSSTKLEDGREVLIAGEHEDYYDPDFYIYNDVVVKHPDGIIEIYGYPEDVFPPTDFHTATLVGNQIILIGNLGYVSQRKVKHTQVYVLELDTWEIRKIETSGTPPGWVYEQKVSLIEDGQSILLEKGKVLQERGKDDYSHVENIDDWELSLSDWSWTLKVKRDWKRWEFKRKDGQSNDLWGMENRIWDYESPTGIVIVKVLFDRLLCMFGWKRKVIIRMETYRDLYVPHIPHEKVETKDFNHHWLRIEGVLVRVVEDSQSVQLTIEGELPEELSQKLVFDLKDKLELIEETEYEVIAI